MTPRQTCLQPNGIGRNLRSKTRWFTGFCNSHQVSHFATFFIDARAEISVAESRLLIQETCTPTPSEDGQARAQARSIVLGAVRAGVRFWTSRQTRCPRAPRTPARSQGGMRKERRLSPAHSFPVVFKQVRKSFGSRQ